MAGPEFEMRVGSTDQFGYLAIKPVPSEDLLAIIAPRMEGVVSSRLEALRKGEGEDEFIEVGFLRSIPNIEISLGIVAMQALYENGQHTANLDCTVVNLANGGELF
jgi:hypothetical protein